jgi:hypothetical protein
MYVAWDWATSFVGSGMGILGGEGGARLETISRFFLDI